MAPNPDSAGQPLFIVDRDWLRQGPKARKSWTGNVRNKSLYGLAIQVTQYNTPEKSPRGKRKSRSSGKRRDKQDDNSGSECQSEQEQQAREARPTAHPQPDARQSTFVQTKDAGTKDSLPTISDTYAQLSSWPTDQPLHGCTNLGPPGFERIKGLECYLDYCKRSPFAVVHLLTI